MSSYFSIPSFARAKKNKEQLEKTNPQNPVLKDEDEKFLNKQISKDESSTTAEALAASECKGEWQGRDSPEGGDGVC